MECGGVVVWVGIVGWIVGVLFLRCIAVHLNICALLCMCTCMYVHTLHNHALSPPSLPTPSLPPP